MKFKLDTHKIIGTIRPLHGLCNAPIISNGDSLMHYLKEAGIPYSRLHDMGGAFGGSVYVDVPNIFRNENADPEDENSYDFAFTDHLLKILTDYGCEPIYRLGVTIENYQKIKAYRIHPPKDMKKWANVCKHIVMHYNNGWANGFYYNIKNWEVWNEPENDHPDGDNQMWSGTMEQYFELYKETATTLKSAFPDINVGGYNSCGLYGLEPEKYEGTELRRQLYRLDFFHKFIEFAEENKLPLDFFAWHTYESVSVSVKFAEYIRQYLDSHGFENTKSYLLEWNSNSPWNTDYDMVDRHTPKAAADAAAMIIAMHHTGVDIATFYQSSIGPSIFNGIINPYTRKPFKLYYVFKAFNELYRMKTQVYCNADGLYTLAAKSENTCKVLIANASSKAITLDISEKVKSTFTIDRATDFEEIPSQQGKLSVKGESVYLVEFEI